MKILVLPSWYPPNGGYFFQELSEALLQQNNKIDVLEEDLNRIFRAFHTVKGNAGLQEINSIKEIAHSFETVLSDILEKKVIFDNEVLKTVKNAISTIIKMVKFVSENLNENYDFNIDLNINSQEKFEKTETKKSENFKNAVFLIELNLQDDFFRLGHDLTPYLEELEDFGKVEHFKVDLEKILPLDQIEAEDSYLFIEILLSKQKIEDIEMFQSEILDIFELLDDAILVKIELIYSEELQNISDNFNIMNLKKFTTPQNKHKLPAQKIKSKFEIDTNKNIKIKQQDLDSIYSIIDESFYRTVKLLKESLENKQKNDFNLITRELAFISKNLEKASNSLLRTKTQPIENLANYFTSSWNAITNEVKKEINLKFEYDNSLVVNNKVFDSLKDIFIHLLRNSADHGIEPELERVEKYKPKRGNVKITIFWEQDELNITFFDDGKGININKVVEKAINKNIISPHQKDEYLQNKKRALDLIFEDSFSTKEQNEITDISGRGFGMSSVKEAILKQNGSIKISSEFDRFTKFNILIPVKEILKKGRLIKIENYFILIPEQFISDTKNIESSDILSNFFNFESQKQRDRIYLKCQKNNFYIQYDQDFGLKEHVIKPLNKFLKPLSIFDGMAVLSNGEILFSITCLFNNFFIQNKIVHKNN